MRTCLVSACLQGFWFNNHDNGHPKYLYNDCHNDHCQEHHTSHNDHDNDHYNDHFNEYSHNDH